MLQAAAIFSDHMVLQQNRKICVFGEGENGRRITVALSGEIACGTCRNGKWTVYLPERKADINLTMEITDGTETIRFTDIAIGEVWLAGGQSNMELELKDADKGLEALRNANSFREQNKNSGIRFYYTPKLAYKDSGYEEQERLSHWELFDGQDAAKWSAVGFFFAEKLARKLNVTVGVIGCNWGGTSASCWMSREAILSRENTRSYVEEYDRSELLLKPEAEQIKEYKEYQAYQDKWDKDAAKVYEKEPMASFDRVQELLGPCRYPGPVNCANCTRPAGLYETMLKRVSPYTLRGFLYYQGESDEHKPESYFDLLVGLIRQWREDWGDETIPFLMVQLPMHRYQHDPDTKSWCILRENQMKAYKMIRNTGIAVAIDCGQFHEIHPRNKKPVGERLALQALAGVYQLIPPQEAFGPLYRDCLYRDGGMELSFDYAEDGMECTAAEPEGFELSGADGNFQKAKARICQDRIFLESEEIEDPVMARYLWTNYGEVTVFGRNGLPLAPFRTHPF